MNIAFFLTPKSEVITLTKSYSIAEALKIMSQHRYSSLPVIDNNGKYVNALSEGDILWYLRDHLGHPNQFIEQQSIRKIKRHYNINAVSIDADIDSLIDLATAQAFVPVVDDQEVFIGIIKRSAIINYCMERMQKEQSMLVS